MLESNKPSMDQWLKEAKQDPVSQEEGMYLVHNGIVRKTPKAWVREGLQEGETIEGMWFSYDRDKALEAIGKTREMPGIFHVRVWMNEGELMVGDDIMYVLIGGDIRPNVIEALQYLVGRLKTECVVEIERTSV